MSLIDNNKKAFCLQAEGFFVDKLALPGSLTHNLIQFWAGHFSQFGVLTKPRQKFGFNIIRPLTIDLPGCVPP